jgi:hypothetical protein
MPRQLSELISHGRLVLLFYRAVIGELSASASWRITETTTWHSGRRARA